MALDVSLWFRQTSRIVITKVKTNAPIEAPFVHFLNTISIPSRYVNGCEGLGFNIFVGTSYTGGRSNFLGQRICFHSKQVNVGLDSYLVLTLATVPFRTAFCLTSAAGSRVLGHTLQAICAVQCRRLLRTGSLRV